MLQLNVLGNLGRDAEVKNINGKDYISFSVASTEKQGEQELTTWVSVLAGHNPNLLPHLKKGQQVFVSGRMKAGIYQNNNNIGLDISVFASTLQLCGGKKEETQQPQQPIQAQPSTPPVTQLLQNESPFPPPFPPAVDDNGNANSDNLPF